MRKWRVWLAPVALSVTVLAADGVWKDKQVADWSVDDAQALLTSSPWVKSVTPAINRQSNNGQRRGSFGMGIPGMGGGMGRRGGMGGGGYPRNGGDDSSTYGEPPTLKLRWESAMPVREAELKAKDNDAPTLDQDHYAIAVYGVPARMLGGDSQHIEDQLKKKAAIKRDGKKDLKPSSVEVLQRDDGPVIVYLFPRSKEISREDRRLEFDAEAGRLQFTESFYTDEMTFQGKLEL